MGVTSEVEAPSERGGAGAQGAEKGGGPELPPLVEVLEECGRLGGEAVVVFDLDSTLLDNRPRQARILCEYGLAYGEPRLASARPEHWQGWDVRAAMRNAGLDEEAIVAHYPRVRAFWRSRFFTSAYCAGDGEVPGAARFVSEVASRGAVVAYVTGRPMAMGAGTLLSFARHGFPLPDDAPGRPLDPRASQIKLMLKPRAELDDDDWKREALPAIAALGRVVAVFDNEPAHANIYRAGFPEARVFRLLTDCSGRPIEPLDGIEPLDDFTIPP